MLVDDNIIILFQVDNKVLVQDVQNEGRKGGKLDVQFIARLPMTPVQFTTVTLRKADT